MDCSTLKPYAIQARRDCIQAVTESAAKYGLTAKTIESITEEGDVALIGGRAFPRSITSKRKALEERITRQGFEQTMEAMAYTWFNRLVAIRYMELHGYLDHGYRVLSHPEGKNTPEILEHAEHLDLPGLDKTTVIDLKLDGTKENELYRMLLLAQCNALHQAMPFLFEKIGDETELLLPANLLHTDSLIRQLVEQVDEELWQEIEIIGWLYQFYISEKKDQVIGKVVKSEDIPAATQLFTPNWIVKYMVQNSLGAMWLATYPQSPLKGQMEYYIEPAEQTDEVKAQLAAITPSQLNPEELTLIDPASGSGHILVEAYELFKAIYLERGYRQRDVPQLILEKNLFGLDIDERAAQLTGFALMMKGRADDRRLFERGVKLNVMALVDCAGFDAEGLAMGVELSDFGLKPDDLTELQRLFEHATTFGSLIQVPEKLAKKLPALKKLSDWVTPRGSTVDWVTVGALKRLGPLVRQAELLAAQYDAVVANPPYMGSKAMSSLVKEFVKDHFSRSKSDLFSVSTERFLILAKPSGFSGLMTPFTWMFLKSYESLRGLLLETKALYSLIQPEYHAFFDSAYVPVCTFIIQNCHTSGYQASFIKLSEFYGAELQPQKTLEAIGNPDCGWFYRAKPDDFNKIPGSPIAFWVSDKVREIFDVHRPLTAMAPTKQGLATGDNDRFLRQWSEVSMGRIRLSQSQPEPGEVQPRWFPCNKGGAFRKWYGNNQYVVNWENDGLEIKSFDNEAGKLRSRPQNQAFYFREGLTWSAISSSRLSMRYSPAEHMFETKGAMCFPDSPMNMSIALGFANSKLVNLFLSATSPTLDFHEGHVGNLPFASVPSSANGVALAVQYAKLDWDAYERSWDFQSLPLLTASSEPTPTLESSYTAWTRKNRDTIAEMKCLEDENNRLFIDAYGLQEELTPDSPLEQITLTVNPAYRYGGKLTEEEQWTRFRQDTMEELVSYAIGCMMGRYSLDKPGLIYAHSGNQGFDPSQYQIFPADDDGIIPITDYPWFADDAANRLEGFIATAWPREHLEENLSFLAEGLGSNRNEQPRDTIRRYLATGFFKHHLSLYKKRPIYWLFSSGKQRGFQCLVYLHRYHEGTLSRMRTEYVIPLLGKIAARMDHLDSDIPKATSTSHLKKLEKEKDLLRKQQTELQAFDEQLRHYADQRISLDLDDGVKVNYGKFGNLLAEVKTVTGSSGDK